MVNDIRETNRSRAKIIEVLTSADAPVSGEYLAGELGLSRVAVWKHVRTLVEHGYRIEATNRGYVLESRPTDSLLPWDLKNPGATVKHFAETDSTMNRALEAALAGAESGSLYIAERQNAGRGTGGKAWESASGGLFFTLLLRPDLHPAHYFRALSAAHCAIVETLRDCGVKAAAVWPNDILAFNADTGETAKAGGILCEHLCSGNAIRFLNLGIGLNTGDAPALPGTARLAVSRKALLEGFLERMKGLDPALSGLEERWAALCPHTNRAIEIREGSTVLRGLFLGIDRFGNARFSPESGSDERRFQPGSASIVNKGRYA